MNAEAEYWEGLRAEDQLSRMRDEEDERSAALGLDDPPYFPPVYLGRCAAPGCQAPVYDDEGRVVGTCVHWDPDDPEDDGEEAPRKET